MLKKKRIALLLCGIAALALVAGIWAYYSSTNPIQNQLQTKSYGNELVEKFTPKSDWQPGEKVEKEVGVTNTGDYNLFVRIKMEETWTLSEGTLVSYNSDSAKFHSATSEFATQTSATDGLTTGDESVVYKEIDLTGWTLNADDGYWYYTLPLKPSDSTGNLLKSITLAGNTDMGAYITTKYYTTANPKPNNTEIGSDPATQWVEYSGNVPDGTTYTRAVSDLNPGKTGYADAAYVLTITSETLQGTKEAFEASGGWNTTPADVKDSWGVN